MAWLLLLGGREAYLLDHKNCPGDQDIHMKKKSQRWMFGGTE